MTGRGKGGGRKPPPDDPTQKKKTAPVSYTLRFTNGARKDLRGMDRQVARRILDALEDLASDPFAAKDVKPLKGRTNAFRLRVGAWRVIYEIENDMLVVLVLRVGHRREVYR